MASESTVSVLFFLDIDCMSVVFCMFIPVSYCLYALPLLLLPLLLFLFSFPYLVSFRSLWHCTCMLPSVLYLFVTFLGPDASKTESKKGGLWAGGGYRQ